MAEQTFTPAETLLANTVMSALDTDVLSHEQLFGEIDVKEITRNFPRDVWKLIHEKMEGLHIAPIVEVKNDNLGNGIYRDEHIEFLNRMLTTAMDPQFEIMNYEDLFKAITVVKLIKIFPKQCWRALTHAMVSFGLADLPETEDAPDVSTDD